MSKKTFVVSDCWFGRPYGDQLEDTNSVDYNSDIINKWNDKVGKKDKVYILGGIGVGYLYDILFQLNGEIHILNTYYTQDDKNMMTSLYDLVHNSIDTDLCNRIIFDDCQMLILPDLDCVFSYFPLLEWPGKETGTFCFHGMDARTEMNDHNINCQMKQWDYYPVDVEEVINNINHFKEVVSTVQK